MSGHNDDIDKGHNQGQPDRSAVSSGQGGLPSLRSAKLARPTSYEVGYGKPPAEHRFQKGRSGNPKGRPRGAKNKPKLPGLHEERLKQIVIEEAYRTITVRDGERSITVPMAQAVIRALAVNAAKGQPRAQRLFAELLAGTESANRRLHDEWLNAAMQYKIDWERELWRRERLGITDLPEPLPHPDHVVIDLRAGTAHIRGPATREEKAMYNRVAQEKADLQRTMSLLRRRLKRETDPAERDDIERHLRIGEETLAKMRQVVPD